MPTWQNFYQEIKDPSWPDCDSEDEFWNLPKHIQEEIQQVFNYAPNSLKKESKLENKNFIANAPKKVVEEEKQRLDQAISDATKLEGQIEKLKSN